MWKAAAFDCPNLSHSTTRLCHPQHQAAPVSGRRHGDSARRHAVSSTQRPALLQQRRHKHCCCAAVPQDTASHADTEPAAPDETAALERQMQAALVAQNDEASGAAEVVSSRDGGGAAARSASGDAADQFAGRRVAVLQASKTDVVNVTERDRSLGEYMTLPASQYSVLDAKRIERIDDDTFRCYVGGISFLNFKVEPVLTVSVVVGQLGPTVSLLKTELEGSKAVRNINDRFTATMTNRVRWRDAADASAEKSSEGSAALAQAGDSNGSGVSVGGPSVAVTGEAAANPDTGRQRQITSDTDIKVTLEIPGWLKFVSEGALSSTGSKVMQKVLNTMVPRFLAQLAADYDLWAAGDESRKPIGTGQL